MGSIHLAGGRAGGLQGVDLGPWAFVPPKQGNFNSVQGPLKVTQLYIVPVEI